VDADEYERMAAAGASHWWYDSTRRLLEQLMSPYLPAGEALFLDAAGGSGATGSWLARRAPTVVADVDGPSVRYAATRTEQGYLPELADLNALPHRDHVFDAVLCVTALCHRMNTDPAATVAELGRVTRPGGVVCLMEPGVRKLRRGHDRVTHTARRFSRHDLARMLTDTGLELRRVTGAYTFLVPPAAVLAVIERGRQTSDVGRNESGLGGVMGALARVERAALRRTDLPTGLSAIAIAVKPAV
jgi:SAM-dependent methyltransferase